MKAIVLNEFGSAANLQLAELPTPAIKPAEVLVKIKAISINPVDVKTRAGKGMKVREIGTDPLILGWDISGVVENVGAEVTQFKAGDEVFGMVNFPGLGHAYAEYVAAPADQLALKPANISHEEAAAATLAALTAYQFMVHKYLVKPNDRVLIHAAAGGVGHYAVQLAKLAGAYVIATASAHNRDFVLSLGADEVIDYKTQRFEEVVSDIDFVLETVGGENIDRSFQVIKQGGTLISIPSGLSEDVVARAKAKGIHGSFQLVKSDGADMQALAKLLQEGKLRSHVSATFPFVEMSAAHLQIETGSTKGKVIVTV